MTVAPPRSPGSTGRRWATWAAFLVAGAVLVWVGAGLAGHVARGGLRPCERLDDRLCADLGPEDCALWKTRLGRVGSGSVQPHRLRGNRGAIWDVAVHKLLGWDMSRSDNPLCYDQLADDMYPQLLGAVRGAASAAKGRAGAR